MAEPRTWHDLMRELLLDYWSASLATRETGKALSVILGNLTAMLAELPEATTGTVARELPGSVAKARAMLAEERGRG